MKRSDDLRACMAAAVAAAGVAAAAVAQNQPPAPLPTAEQLYDQRLAEGDWVTTQTLSIADVAYSIELNVTAKDDRESVAVSEWHGVHQTGDAATVLFSVLGMDVVFADDVSSEEEASCRQLNDGRWWCEVDISSFKIREAFYLEQAPPLTEPAAPARAPPGR